MGYNLVIGEKVVREYEDGYTSVYAEIEHFDDAPAFGEPTDYTNERWPSYGVWHDWCKTVGLIDVFYAEDGHFRGGHPGAFPVDEEFQSRINKAYEEWNKIYEEDEDAEFVFNRLIWLKYWTDWALENCEEPVVANS